MLHRQPSLRQTPTTPESPSRAAAAIVITCLLLVIVPAMVALIGYRSIMIHGPSTAIVIGGDPSLDGAKIEVIEAAEPHRRWDATLDRGNEWQSPILLDPGVYHINVVHRGKNIMSEDFAPDKFHGVRDDLPSMVTIIGSRALADARIEIVKLNDTLHPMHPTPVRFSAENHYEEAIYLMPGDYRAIAHSTSGVDRVLEQADFKVDRTENVRVELAKPALAYQ